MKENKEILHTAEEIAESTKQIAKTGIRQHNLERHKRVWDSLIYSHQRMDVLIISISGAGIYTSLEAIKYLNNKHLVVNGCLKYGAIAFLFAIIANFIAQKLSSRVNMCDYQIYDIEVFCDEEGIDKSRYQKQRKKLNKKSKRTDKQNKAFNRISIVLMFAGLIFLINFFATKF
ncbi:MAG: hypothetical protein H7199_04315 [Burkholderiales bacterium]|nr:hypothetical protein [Flavobacterium sp.]